jgi:hypothetical protein
MQTEKDAGIVGWIGRLGAADAEHVMDRFAMGRSWTYARLSRLVKDGLLEQRTLLYRQPGLYLATADGLRWRGLQRARCLQGQPQRVSARPGVATAAVALHRVLPAGWEVLSEREICVQESDQGELIASARLGELPGGRPALHRPDLALITPGGSAVAVEVELSVKAPRRLAAICRAWARARHISGVCYLAPPAVARAVERAVAETRSEDRIVVPAVAGSIPVAHPRRPVDRRVLVTVRWRRSRRGRSGRGRLPPVRRRRGRLGTSPIARVADSAKLRLVSALPADPATP